MKTNKSDYSQVSIKRIAALAMKTKDAIAVSHIFPRAYCVAKPAPLCAVFATPFVDAEPQVRQEKYSAYECVYRGAEKVKVGDWCSLAYVRTPTTGGKCVVEILG